MKRVKQISLDILVDDTVDGAEIADEIDKFLEKSRFTVVGYGFNGDVTEVYKKYYSKLAGFEKCYRELTAD